MKKFLTAKKVIFLLIFGALALIANQINFSAVVGTKNQFFTLFQFLGPIAGAFLGPIFGPIAILLSELADHLIQAKVFSLINLYRLTPMLFAAFYFGTIKSKNKWITRANMFVPLAAIIAFIAHPVGRQVWFFSLYWLIPIIVRLKWFKNILYLRSLGATFTAHSVGGAAWIWTVPMTAGQWITLIPIVAYERFLFAAGIAVSYVVLNTALDKLDQKWKLPVLKIEKEYIISRKLFRLHG